MAERVPLYVFSGTGNTLMVAREFERQAAGIGMESEIRVLGAGGMDGHSDRTVPNADLFGLFYPVYGFGTPRIALDWVKRLPPGGGRRCFLIVSAAGGEVAGNTGAPYQIVRRLERKGYEVPYVRILRMGSNWLVRFPDDFTRQLMRALPEKCAESARSVVSGDFRRPPRRPVLHALTSFIAINEDQIGARVWGRLLKAGADCDGCGLCAKRCPTGNITKDESGRISFGWSCQWCMRCVYGCPKDAIVPRFFKSAVLAGGYDPKAILAAPDTGEPKEKLDEMRRKSLEYFDNPAS